MKPGSPENVQLFIDELVLEGSAAIDEITIKQAIGQQMGQLILQRGLPPNSQFLPNHIVTANSMSPQIIGQQVASSFYQNQITEK